jgi:hypothetical protein
MDIGAIINNPMMGGMVEQGIKAFFKSGAVKVLGKTREGHLVISLKEPRVESEKVIIKDEAIKKIILQNMGAKE